MAQIQPAEHSQVQLRSCVSCMQYIPTKQSLLQLGPFNSTPEFIGTPCLFDMLLVVLHVAGHGR
jgi:hypothetical protein